MLRAPPIVNYRLPKRLGTTGAVGSKFLVKLTNANTTTIPMDSSPSWTEEASQQEKAWRVFSKNEAIPFSCPWTSGFLDSEAVSFLLKTGLAVWRKISCSTVRADLLPNFGGLVGGGDAGMLRSGFHEEEFGDAGRVLPKLVRL